MYARQSRRQFLRRAGLSTAAVAIGPAVLPVTQLLEAAGAQQAAAPTPAELATFAESVELAAVSIYGDLRPQLSRPPAVSAATAYSRQHQDHANTIGPLGGDKRFGKPNALLLQTVQDRLGRAAAEDDVIQIAYELEGGLASTYLFIISSTADAQLVKVAGSILPVDAQHAVVLGSMLGKTTKELTAPDAAGVGYETEDKHFDPATFPTAPTTTTSVVGGK